MQHPYDITPRVIPQIPSGTRARGRARVADEKVVEVKLLNLVVDIVVLPMTIIDPNLIVLVPIHIRIGNGVLDSP